MITRVNVKSISGLKIEQIPKKFEQNLQRAASSHVFIHAGRNNIESASVDELINQMYQTIYKICVMNCRYHR